jgi:hypothetical protein
MLLKKRVNWEYDKADYDEVDYIGSGARNHAKPERKLTCDECDNERYEECNPDCSSPQ